MYCSKCGKYIDDNATFCSGCGVRIDKSSQGSHGNVGSGDFAQTQQQTFNFGEANSRDRGGVGWFLLGFFLGLGFIPIILFFIWRKDLPKRAKSILNGIITIWIIFIIFTIVGSSTGLFNEEARTIVNL